MTIKRIFTLVLLVGGALLGQAQIKLAHVNIQELLQLMPEMKTVEAEFKKLQQSYANDIQNSYKEFRSKVTSYQNELKSLTEQELRSREAELRKKGEELQTMESNIQQAEQVASQELQKKQGELLGPVMKKAQDAIQKVARAKGYKYVFDSSPGAGLIVTDGPDLAPSVRKELGF